MPLIGSDLSRDAQTGQGFELLGVRQRDLLVLGCADDGLGNRMLGVVFQSGDGSQRLILVFTGSADKISQFGCTFGQGAGFIHGDNFHIAQCLQRVPFTEQYTCLCGAAGAHHDGGWRGQTHGARACNDQHGHGIDQRKAQCGRRAKNQPDNGGQDSQCHDGGYKPQRDFVDDGLNRQLGTLGLFNHGNNIGQHRILTHCRGFKLQRTFLIDGAANDFIALGFGDGNGLARHHGFIHVALTGYHVTVDRNALAGANQDDIARMQIG